MRPDQRPVLLPQKCTMVKNRPWAETPSASAPGDRNDGESCCSLFYVLFSLFFCEKNIPKPAPMAPIPFPNKPCFRFFLFLNFVFGILSARRTSTMDCNRRRRPPGPRPFHFDLSCNFFIGHRPLNIQSSQRTPPLQFKHLPGLGSLSPYF